MRIKLAVICLAVLIVVGLAAGLSCAPLFPAPTGAPTSDGSTGLATIEEAWRALFQDYVEPDRLDPQKLSRAAIRAMLEELDDPYTSYLDPELFNVETQHLQGKYQGIGAFVDSREGRTIVISAMPGSPAEKAGLMAGDQILEVDGLSTAGLSVEEVVGRIRGQAGTSVELLVLHEGAGAPVKVAMTRAEIQMTTVKWEVRGDLAYIRISLFSEPTAGEFARAVDAILDQQAGGAIRGMVLDLRSNPGGLLNTVVDIASHFVPDGPVVHVVDRQGGRSTLNAVPGRRQVNMPVVVLVNEYSASGSEVLAGALRDRGVAQLAGHKTFGKGSVNTFRQLPDGGAIYITTSRWLTPDGALIEGQGLEPDFVSDLEGEDLVNWAIDYLHQRAGPTLPVAMVTAMAG